MEELVKPFFILEEKTISKFNIDIIKKICNILDIKTKIVESSAKFEYLELKREHGLVSIVNQLNSDIYVNAIGGQKLYSKEFFQTNNINLFFLKMEELDFQNQYASILDLLFVENHEKIKEQLKRYTLI